MTQDLAVCLNIINCKCLSRSVAWDVNLSGILDTPLQADCQIVLAAMARAGCFQAGPSGDDKLNSFLHAKPRVGLPIS